MIGKQINVFWPADQDEKNDIGVAISYVCIL